MAHYAGACHARAPGCYRAHTRSDCQGRFLLLMMMCYVDAPKPAPAHSVAVCEEKDSARTCVSSTVDVLLTGVAVCEEKDSARTCVSGTVDVLLTGVVDRRSIYSGPIFLQLIRILCVFCVPADRVGNNTKVVGNYLSNKEADEIRVKEVRKHVAAMFPQAQLQARKKEIKDAIYAWVDG